MNPLVSAPPLRRPRDAAGPGAIASLGAAARLAQWREPPRGSLTVTDDFSVLDDAVEQEIFTRSLATEGGEVFESILVVQGMHCAACADAVESVLGVVPGVLHARVHAATRRLTLRWDPSQVRLSGLARALGGVGYRVLPMQQALSVDARLRETRQSLWRLFVAGFCMMQVMMYAWPAYVSAPGDIPPDIMQLLRWASWVISLPVIFFASGPFFASAWRDLRRGRVGMDAPVSIGILVSFLVSSAATFDPSGPWGAEVWFDSLTMFVFFLLAGRYLELKARDRTAGALDEMMNRLPQVCERQRADGAYESVSLRRLQVGDAVRVHAGQAFPADGEVLDASALVDEALLTGESHPVVRQHGQAVVAGSFNLAGPVRVRVARIGADTRFAQIVRLMEQASVEKPRLAMLADRIAAPFLVLVLLGAAGAGAFWWQIDHTQALAVAVAVLIVTCPCALSLATPAAMLASAGALARRGVLVRRLQAFETLARVDAVVFDKTGTLTCDRLELRELTTRDGVSREQALALAGALAEGSLHPASRAILDAAKAAGVTLASLAGHRERAGQGMEALRHDGSTVRLGSAEFCGVALRDDDGDDTPVVLLGDRSGWLARFRLQESLRPDAADAVAALRGLGVRTCLLSGDRAAAADQVGRAVGVDRVIAGASPERKLQVVAELQASGLKVAMVGDGLNDGPVLARADTSFALGHAAPLAQSRSDFILQGGQVMDVVRTLTQARATLRTVRQNLAWAGAYNVITVPLALAGFMPPSLAGLGMAVSSLLVIGNALRLARR